MGATDHRTCSPALPQAVKLFHIPAGVVKSACDLDHKSQAAEAAQTASAASVPAATTIAAAPAVTIVPAPVAPQPVSSFFRCFFCF